MQADSGRKLGAKCLSRQKKKFYQGTENNGSSPSLKVTGGVPCITKAFLLSESSSNLVVMSHFKTNRLTSPIDISTVIAANGM